jgi:hypothetical protein
MRYQIKLPWLLVNFALALIVCEPAKADQVTGTESGIQSPSNVEEVEFGSDCWVPGEPGANILPPCDPMVKPPPQLPMDPIDISELSSFEPNPRWWEFWKSGWCARWE